MNYWLKFVWVCLGFFQTKWKKNYSTYVKLLHEFLIVKKLCQKEIRVIWNYFITHKTIFCFCITHRLLGFVLQTIKWHLMNYYWRKFVLPVTEVKKFAISTLDDFVTCVNIQLSDRWRDLRFAKFFAPRLKPGEPLVAGVIITSACLPASIYISKSLWTARVHV